ncbi:MAG: right-handed parallel beta-helix repeat-containing protein [Candidatus Aenigmarchaeota archaeon]|nr:right-handed parallel beta-helix repeat-containing protein [Candidatus Aenigmarchaeota archaeon]
MNAASSGDTILVRAGVYAEGQVEVYKSITLKAESKVILDGLGERHTLLISAHSVTVEGFTIQNSRRGAERRNGLWVDFSGLVLWEAELCKIQRNVFLNNCAGITVYGRSNIIRDNLISDNRLGIRVKGLKNVIINNTLLNNTATAITVCDWLNVIENNTIRGAEDEFSVKFQDGIEMYGSQNIVRKNNIRFTDDGISVYGTNHTIAQNHLILNARGILASDYGSLCRIERNRIEYGSIGIVIGGTKYEIIGNRVCGMGTGIYFEKASENSVKWNNITNNWGSGICMSLSHRNTIQGNILDSNRNSSIYIRWSKENYIVGNYITNSGEDGIRLDWSDWNFIEENWIEKSGDDGIHVGELASDNRIQWNNIVQNFDKGIVVDSSHYVYIQNNNFINNTQQASEIYSGVLWDENYWSDYSGKDENGDGIGDTPYERRGVKDRSPLMNPINITTTPISETFQIFHEVHSFPVSILSNSLILELTFEQSKKQIAFNAIQIGSSGFCNITIPKELLRDNTTHPWKVLLNETEKSFTVTYNQTHSFVYFTYLSEFCKMNVRIEGAEVIPEFSMPILVVLMFLVLVIAIFRKLAEKRENFPNFPFFCSRKYIYTTKYS